MKKKLTVVKNMKKFGNSEFLQKVSEATVRKFRTVEKREDSQVQLFGISEQLLITNIEELEADIKALR